MGRPQFYPKDRQEIALVPAIRALERYREANSGWVEGGFPRCFPATVTGRDHR